MNAIHIIKHFKLLDVTIDSTTFHIRRDVVLKALRWLKKYNRHYHDIVIKEDNLDWMEGDNECDLDINIVFERQEEDAPQEKHNTHNETNTQHPSEFGRTCEPRRRQNR